MNSLTYWWKKYQEIRAIKSEYEKAAKNCQYPQMLKCEYFEKLMEAIK